MVRIALAVALCSALFLAGCGSTKDLSSAGPEERFAHAKALFDDGDIDDAMNEFTVITLQFQGSTVAADAQYYLGECRFAREEFLSSHLMASSISSGRRP